MAANNYFGFTHNGAQYSALSATAYAAPAQAAYVQQTPTAYVATPRAGQTYEAYQTSHGAQQYAYSAVGTRTQVVAPVVQAAPTYDPTKAYYAPIANVTPGAAAAAAAAATVYTLPTDATYQANKYQPLYDPTKKYYPVAPVAAPPTVPTTMYTVTAEPLYQTLAVASSKPVYVPNAYTAQNQGRQITAVKIHTTLPSSIASYTYQPAPQVSVVPAVTVAVTTTAAHKPVTAACAAGVDGAVYSGATMYQPKFSLSSSTPSGVSTSNAVSTPYHNKKPYHFQNRQRITPKTPQLHYCDVCKISCAGPQTYREHLEGQKHKKKEASVKASSASAASSASSLPRAGLAQLHCKMCDVACTGADTYAAHVRGAKHQKVLKLHASLGKPIPAAELANMKKISATEDGVTSKTGSASAKQDGTQGSSFDKAKAARSEDVDDLDIILKSEKDIQPVGQEYIDEARNETGTAVSFYCKLCDCKFTDPNAKIMHMKGRRHRLQYKKKVDPSLQVDVKPLYGRRGQLDDLSHRSNAGTFRRRQYEDKMRMEWEQRRYEEDMMEYHRQMNPNPPSFGMQMGRGRRPDTFNDCHVMAKHASIYPKAEELEAVQLTVSTVEKALQLVSDHIAQSSGQDAENKMLKGVMRVGPLAKGLLLHGGLDMELITLCKEKPTRSLLDQIVENISKQLEEIAKNEFEVEACVEDAGFIVKRLKEPTTRCVVSLTSPIIREEMMTESGGGTANADPPDVFDRQKCLEALATLRHAKWFQAKAGGLQSCVIVIRILKDFCKRIPTWSLLQGWPLELLVEKCLSSSAVPLSAGDALRRVFECIASGILLPGGPGLFDPCEKEHTDAVSDIPLQNKEDITVSAQQALRMIAFQQIHKVLGMEQLQPLSESSAMSQKRLRSNDATGGEDESKKLKKD